jgi:hypothetical protein
MVPADSKDIKGLQGAAERVEGVSPRTAAQGPHARHHQVRHARCRTDEALRQELPEDLPHVFISAVAQSGLDRLKDLIWARLQQPVTGPAA